MTAPIMLKFKSFSIQNFKSIEQMTVDFHDLTCIVGMNGAGKSTILQALDFTSQLIIGRLDDWLEQRGWDIKQLTNQCIKPKRSSAIRIEVVFEDVPQTFAREIKWNAVFNARTLKCEIEEITADEKLEFSSTGSTVMATGVTKASDILWDYTGSILSSLNESWFAKNSVLRLVREALLGISSLELLSPAILKKSSRTVVGRIGISGENLSSFIHGLSKEQREELVESLRFFYPHLSHISTHTKKGGWVVLGFEEHFKDQKTISESIHINDGLLRILAVLAQQKHGAPTLLLLDEIENGINQEIMGRLVEFLSSGKTQVVITTHSPLLLNYLPDDKAVDDVYFVYRTDTGSLGLKKFFQVIDDPAVLDFAGPGEVYANTDLGRLAEKCRFIDIASASED